MPGLVSLPPGNWSPIGGVPGQHTDNHYGLPAMNESVLLLADEYRQVFGDFLELNDMSLIQGGLFDVFGTNLTRIWKPRHFSHRFGDDIDVRLPPRERRLRLRALVQLFQLERIHEPGRSFGGYEARPIVAWAATEAAPDPPGFIDDDSVPLAAHSIAPSSAKSEFKLVSPDPPGTVTYYVKGEVPEPVPAEDADVDALPAFDADIEVDSVSGSTVGPVPVVAPEFFEGGRRPATDGFLVFVNLADGDIRTNPTSIIVKFGARGETVDRSSFRAELNGVDVTAAFVAASAPGDLAALFAVGSSPLQAGKNVLLTSVSGVIPGTSRTAGDVDRITFTVQ